MKSRFLILIFSIVIPFAGIAQYGKKITDLIIYTVKFQPKANLSIGNYIYVDSLKNRKIINEICDLIYDGKLGTQKYIGDTIGDKFYYQLFKDRNRTNFLWNDTITFRPNKWMGKDKSKFTYKEWDAFSHLYPNYQVYRNLINSLTFQEEWLFDKNNKHFIKKVDGILLFEDKYTNFPGMRTSYYVPLNDSTENTYDSLMLVAKNIVYDVCLTRNENVSCDDKNWWYNYLEASKREDLFNQLTYMALHDTINPIEMYNPIFPFDSLIPRPKDYYDKVNLLFFGRSYIYTQDYLLLGLNDTKIKAMAYELNDWSTIKAIRFHEDWYFDTNSLSFEKKVKGIGLVVDTYDMSGNVTGQTCLIYYKLNK